jgi:hypothetical protein
MATIDRALCNTYPLCFGSAAATCGFVASTSVQGRTQDHQHFTTALIDDHSSMREASHGCAGTYFVVLNSNDQATKLTLTQVAVALWYESFHKTTATVTHALLVRNQTQATFNKEYVMCTQASQEAGGGSLAVR